ncbi:MAG TPA: ankyrin repeat domain-containing protein [Bryobacteraceae bacterium]|nr:ankyrin repeat domain-containing protein [Bryobacteraceae bacterium]
MRAGLVAMALASAAFGASVSPAGKLAEAVKNGERSAAITLINQKINVNTPEADGTTAIAWATRQDDLDLVDRLIRAGADVKADNRYGVTPLSLACINGNAAMIEKLLKAGADPNATGAEDETPLMTVARTGSVPAAKVLLAHGAKADARETWHGETALMWAAAQQHPEMVKALIDAGADVNAVSTVVKWERQTTAEPREKWLPLGGFTPLMFAAREGCVECAKVLIDAKADVNLADPDGITPMVNSIINGHYDVATLLLEKGADPNLSDKTGRAALYAAVDAHTMPASNRPSPDESHNDSTSLELIKGLLAKGASVNMQLKTQQPYRTKVDRGNDTMLTTGTTPMVRAAKAGDTAVMAMLLAKGADPKLATRNGINPLMAAAGLGSKEEDAVGRKKTEKEIIDSIDLCLKAGVDLNAVDSRGQTALHGAAQKGWDQVVQYLADHGAKLTVKDQKGLTPVDAAMGREGGLGFDNTTGDVHESTAALLGKLIAAKQ